MSPLGDVIACPFTVSAHNIARVNIWLGGENSKTSSKVLSELQQQPFMIVGKKITFFYLKIDLSITQLDGEKSKTSSKVLLQWQPFMIVGKKILFF